MQETAFFPPHSEWLGETCAAGGREKGKNSEQFLKIPFLISSSKLEKSGSERSADFKVILQ